MTIKLELSDVAIAEIAERAAAVAASKLMESGGWSPWLTRREAAEYLRLPLSRLEKDRAIPCHRDGGRVLYHRDELDEYFLALGPCGAR